MIVIMLTTLLERSIQIAANRAKKVTIQIAHQISGISGRKVVRYAENHFASTPADTTPARQTSIPVSIPNHLLLNHFSTYNAAHALLG